MGDVSVDLSLTRNLLLRGLSSADQTALRAFLVRFDLAPRTVLESANEPVSTVHFVESGFISVMANTTLNRQVEVGIIGREGMSGIPLVLGSDRSPNRTIVQAAGTSLAIGSGELVRLMNARPTLHHRFDLFVQSFMVQITQTTLANSKANVEQRLARWLLMARDRMDGDTIPLTHEFLSIMIGVRRAAVTIALHNLEAEQFIRASRGMITIRDHEGLRTFADGLYGIAEQEYDRLLETSFSHDRSLAAAAQG